MAKKTGIQKALDKYDGSPTRLAEAIGGDVLRQHIEHWLKAGVVPAAKAGEVSIVTGISLDQLNPTVNWDSIRSAVSKVS